MSGVHGFERKFKTQNVNEFLKNEALKNNLVNKDENSAHNESDKGGKTTKTELDAKVLLNEIENNKSGTVSDRIDDFTVIKYDDRAEWDNGTDIKDFIIETLKSVGYDAENNPDVVNQLFEILIKAMVDGEIGIRTNVSSVTELISININLGVTIERTMLIQQLQQAILGQSASVPKSTNGEVKALVLKELQKIIDANPTCTTDPIPTTVSNPEEPETVVIDTPEKAMEALVNKFNEINVDGNMSIKDFLLQFKTEASQYIRLQFGYEEQFADIIAMFLAKVVSDTSGVTSGLMKNAKLSDIKDKFLALVQDMSFLDTSDNRFMSVIVDYDNGDKKCDVRITSINPSKNGDGYRLSGDKHINYNNDLYYDDNGSINQGVFFKFMTDYLRDTVYGNLLSEFQLELLYIEILKKFSGHSGEVALNAYDKKDGENFVNKKYDNNGNGSWLDDFYRAMMEVATEFVPINIDEIKDEDVNLNNLFENQSSLSVTDINNNRNSYLLNNDAATRLILGELINMSDRYNISTEAFNPDFMNIFVQMLNKECGIADTLDSKGNQVLTRAALEKYLEKHTIQELKDFIQGTELRNAYFESTFKINGEIEGFAQSLTGDCWLLSGLMSLNSSPEGKEIIKKAISYNPETGEYSVTFYGGWDHQNKSLNPSRFVQKTTTYTFTKEELFELIASGKYTKIQKSEDGTLDWDIFLMEVAVSKLREEQYGRAPFGTWARDNYGDRYLFMGSQDELLGYLTGIGMDIGSLLNVTNNTSEDARRNLYNLVMSLIAQGLIDEDGTIHNYAFYFSAGSHAYAITKITADRIYFVDPYDSSKVYYTTWAEFIPNASYSNSIVHYYDANTNKEIGKIVIEASGYAGPLDESPALNQNEE